jgi:hypothetical protein
MHGEWGLTLITDRISGSKLQIDRLKAEVNAGRRVNLHDQDIHNVCSLVKLWIREIPDGLMPGECFWLAVEAVREYKSPTILYSRF